MRTRLAKILIYTTLVLSVGFAAFALGVATNRVDWVGTPPRQSEGVIVQRTDEIKQLTGLFDNVTARYAQQKVALASAEQKRKAEQEWYAQQLKAVVDGPTYGVLVYEGGKLKVDQNGRPALGPATVKYMKALDVDLDTVDKEIRKLAQDIQGLLKQEEALSLELNGGPGKPRGLRATLQDSQANQKAAEAELLYVKRLSVNAREQLKSLEHRKRQLQSRLEVLKKVGVAAQLP